MSANIDPDRILEAVNTASEGKRPPIHLWHPDKLGEIDMRIAKDGRWYHEGGEIKRLPLVALFSSILRKEPDGKHYLVTPQEKYLIEVELAPFVAVSVFCQHQGKKGQQIVFATNIAESLRLDVSHPLRVVVDKETAEPTPFVLVRDELEALISRSAFYALTEMAEQRAVSGRNELYVRSAGAEFLLGEY